MTTERARNTTVNLGAVTMEWLMLPSGEFRVRAHEVARLILANQNNATRNVKALLGKDSELIKVKTENNPNAETALSEDEFYKAVRVAAEKGNRKAVKLMSDLFGLALHQLVSDAFGIKFEKEQRVSWLNARNETKREFRTLTDAIQKHVGHDAAYSVYISQFQSALDICNGCRDTLDEAELVRLARAETTAAALLSTGMAWGEILGLLTKM